MTCRWALLLTAALILAPLTIPFPVGGSPATGALAQSQGGAGMSCATTAQIAAAWPPSGEVSLLLKGGLNRLETGGWRLDDVEIVALDCGNTRGLGGVDTFLVYRVPWRLIPASGSLLGDGSPPFAVPSPFVLAVLPQGTSQMINLHVVQPLDEFGGPSLGFQDVTGDGVPEVIFEGPRFRSTGELRIWRWQDGAYASVFDGSGYVGGLRMVDLDGDGRPEMVLAGRVEAPNTASGFAWPLTYRWNGQRFVLSLVSAAHTEIIRDLEERLRNPQFALEPATVGIYATFLGHAYTIQGRTGEAREAYSRAWVAYPRALEPYRCDEPTQAVLDFYVYLPGQLPRAYGMAEAALGGSFPEFAAGFARTRRVSTSERQLLARDGDRYLVGVRVQAVDLTEDGETETLFSGVWRIRRDSATRVCTLEEATLTVGAPAWSVPAAPVPVPPALGGWAEVVGAEQCVPVRVSPGLDRTMIRCLPDGFATLVAAGPELHDNAIWWGLAGQGWTTDDALRRRQGAAPSATSRPGLREAGQVAYLGPDSNFWLVNADGTERQRLTNDEPPYSLSDLVWSPRGDAIAFTRRDLTPAAQSSSVRIMSLDGRVQRDIPDASTPAWSPDGRKLAYLDIQRTRPAEARTPDLLRPAIMNLETDQVLVIDSPVQAASFVFGEGPRWSPDSASLVYVAGRRDIHLVSADGRPIRTMNACARLECSQAARPTLSPSGDALAWLVSQPGGLSPTSPPGGPPAIGPPGAPPPFGPSGEPPPIGPPGAPRPFGSAAEPPPLGPPGVPPPVGPPGGPTDRLGRLWLVAEDVATGQGYIQIDLGRLGGETMCPPGALSWSAGGRAIVVNARCLSPGQNGVVQVDVATGALQITPAWDVTAVSLSSDERYMAFSTVLPLPTDVARGLQGGFRELRHLWVSSIDGGDPVLLGEGRNPVWRPMTP